MLVAFGGCVINVDKVQYGVVSRYDNASGEWRWRFTLMFEDSKELKWNNFKDKQAAIDQQDAFLEAVEDAIKEARPYLIQELM